MVSCLLIGAIAFVTILSVIPTYSNGVYRHMLLRDMESQQIRTGQYPGNWFMSILIRSSAFEHAEGFQHAREVEHLLQNRYIPNMDVPILASRKHYSLDRFFFYPRTMNRRQMVSIHGIENIWNHVDIIEGRQPSAVRGHSSDDPTYGVLEFAMSRTDYLQSDIRLGQEFDIFTYSLPADIDRQFGQAVAVGVFEPRFEEPFWFSDLGFASTTFVVDYDYFVERFVETESSFVSSVSFFYCFDYSEIRPENISNILDTTRRVRSHIQATGTLNFQMENTLRVYNERRATLEFMLWILIIPILIILVFYIYMVSKLMISHESNEIAVLKSRGARNTQVFSSYALISVFIAAVAFATGPPLGLLIGRVLGLSNGFMEFVARRGIPLELSKYAFLYAALAAVLFIIVMLIPALKATRDTIVKSKQKKSRRVSAPLWQKLWVDVVLIAVSLYALFMYYSSAEVRAIADVAGTDVPVDPLVLLASSLFVLGAGLAFLRIFPLIVKFIYHIGKNIWPPTLYSTLLSISRFKGSSQFLALFLVFNIGLGVFSATAARTLNLFLEDRIRYDIGADIVLTQNWSSEILFYRAEVDTESGELSYHRIPPPMHEGGSAGGTADNEIIVTRTRTSEPPFDVFQNLEGVEYATRVFTRTEVRITEGQRNATAALMGIVPHEFGRIAWLRSDLLPAHMNEYLNLMTADPSAIFMSTAMRDEFGFRVGDRVRIGWRDQSGNLDSTVYGFVDHWPSINPITQPHFIVANLNTIHRQMRIEPYAVWINLEDTTTSYEFYTALNDAEIRVATISDTNQELVILKNDPMLQGMNGTLTLSFLITLAITFIGFLIYWILSIRSRLLQFGILRAMGLSRTGLLTTLAWEQLLVSGTAIAAGFGVGALASYLFVPTLQFMYAPSEQMPAFLITSDINDYFALFIAVGGMLIVGLLILTMMLRKLKPDQVLKLGED